MHCWRWAAGSSVRTVPDDDTIQGHVLVFDVKGLHIDRRTTTLEAAMQHAIDYWAAQLADDRR